jgi:hypothetical protein
MTIDKRAPFLTTLLSLLATPLLWAATATAGTPCLTHEGGLGSGPLAVGFLEGDLGTGRRVCPRSEAGFGIQGGVVFEPELYGTNFTAHVGSGSPIQVSGASRVFGSLALTERLELFGSFQPINGRLIISSVMGQYIGLGNTSVGATLVVYESGPLVLGVTGQLTLPTAIGLYRNAWPVGLDSGIVVAFEPFSFLQLHGQVTGVGSVALTTAAFDPRAGMLGIAGAEFFVLGDWISLVVDYNQLALMNAPLDWGAIAGGFRGRFYAGLAMEAVVVAPILGRERSLAKGRLSLSYRF